MISVLWRAAEFTIKFCLAQLYTSEKNSFLFSTVFTITVLKMLLMIKVLIVTTAMMCTRSCMEFQSVCSVLLPIDQRIIACQELYTLIDSGCILAYFFLFESCCCFSHYSFFTWTLQTDGCFQLWWNIFFYRWWPFFSYPPLALVTSLHSISYWSDNA